MVACGRSQQRLDELSGHLAKLGIAHSTQALTVRDPEQVAAFVETVWERHGRLDVLVNNAGGQFALAAADITPKGWSAVVETILHGTWYASQAAAKRWIAEGAPGAIVNVTTVPGLVAVGTDVERGAIPRDAVAAVVMAVLEQPTSIGKTFELVSGDTPVDDAVAGL